MCHIKIRNSSDKSGQLTGLNFDSVTYIHKEKLFLLVCSYRICLYVCETWSLEVREEHMMEYLRTFEAKRQEKQKNGNNYITRTFIIFTLYKLLE
jgi:hypothetical protein